MAALKTVYAPLNTYRKVIIYSMQMIFFGAAVVSAESADAGISGIRNDHSGIPSDDVFSDSDRCDHSLDQEHLQPFTG